MNRSNSALSFAWGLHTGMHVGVEDQVVLGEWTEVSVTLARLMDEGLDRHEAINAIGNVLMGIIVSVVVDDGERVDIRANYDNELATASWRSWHKELAKIKTVTATGDTAPAAEATAARLNSPLSHFATAHRHSARRHHFNLSFYKGRCALSTAN
jgi:hypothetical protein